MWTVNSDWPQMLAIGIIGNREMTSPGCVNTPGPSRCATILSGLREESPSEGLLLGPGGPASSGYRAGIWQEFGPMERALAAQDMHPQWLGLGDRVGRKGVGCRYCK